MQNEKRSAFTLIELLIVVAIIAILAAIAVPNFLDAQIRSKISRAQADMRSLATGIESYRVDNNMYPCATNNLKNGNANWESNAKTLADNAGDNCNVVLTNGDPGWYPSWTRMCFTIAPGLATLTTPVAYITSYPADPFADKPGLVFGYTNMDNKCWVLWSFGPDSSDQLGDQGNPWWGSYSPTVKLNAQKDLTAPPTTGWAWNDPLGGGLIFQANGSNPTITLIVGESGAGAFTYDATNGTKSRGDLYRLKQ